MFQFICPLKYLKRHFGKKFLNSYFIAILSMWHYLYEIKAVIYFQTHKKKNEAKFCSYFKCKHLNSCVGCASFLYLLVKISLQLKNLIYRHVFKIFWFDLNLLSILSF